MPEGGGEGAGARTQAALQLQRRRSTAPGVQRPGSQVEVNAEQTQVEMWLRSRAALGEVAPGVAIAAGERVLVEVSRKFTPAKLAGLAYQSGLYIQVRGGRLP